MVESVDRRKFIKLFGLGLGSLVFKRRFPQNDGIDTPPVNQPPIIQPHVEIQVQTQEKPPDHQQYLQQLKRLITEKRLQEKISRIKNLLLQTAQGCVVDNGTWVIPSKAYADYFFSRDSLWVLAALKNRQLSQMAVDKFQSDQLQNPNGQIATALRKDGLHPENRDRDEESTMMYVLHNFLGFRLDSQPNQRSLEMARDFILSHVQNGRYVTTGETRSGANFDGTNQIGTYHYWGDTYRPAGRPIATPQVISFNQGLLCVTLRCLKEMGITVDDNVYNQARSAYANLVNPKDNKSLSQREHSDVMDVSALVGEALSLYLFDEPLLSDKRIKATLDNLTEVHHKDGSFLGYKVISDWYGGYRPSREFSGTPINNPGNYQNGASWFLYDALALYAGVRHGVSNTAELFLQRVSSEVRNSFASHEFIRTNKANLGQSDSGRDGYGWNSFIANLLP